MVPKLLRFAPIYQTRVWGGRALETALGRRLPIPGPIGESWEMVDRPEAQSIVIGGPWHGRTLRELVERETAVLLGPKWQPQNPFPILVKWLDARERLSLQVHPPATIAKKLGGEPKTENWYVAEATPDGALIAGLKPDVSRQKFSQAIDEQKLEPLVHRFSAHKGDSLFVPSGRLHAIDAGLLILEIQQNSDTTYRVYDWGRVGLDGKPRQLHVQESLQCIDFDDVEPAAIPAGKNEALLAQCDYFTLRRIPLAQGQKLSFSANQQARIISVAEGRLTTDDPAHPTLERGANVFIPFASQFCLTAEQSSVALITEQFA